MTMNGVWSAPPAGRIIRLAELGDLSDKISEGGGESTFVCKLGSYPGWLYKSYRSATSDEGASRLDRLIGLPGQMSAQDKAVVDQHTAWPAARVVNAANRTTGVLLPMAPETYKYEVPLPSGRTRHKYLEVDLLALSGARQRQMGLPPQSLSHRISVCASIAATADLLERYGLVYLDWSYANIFWHPTEHSAYLIDLDGISFGPRPQIHTPQWDDPHVPLGTTAGNSSDRYRVALLITTCLTGKRVHDAEARTELGELRKQNAEVEQLAELLLVALTAAPASRPTIGRVKAALDAANGPAPAAWSSSRINSGGGATADRGGVTGWKPIGDRTGAARQNPFSPSAPGAKAGSAGATSPIPKPAPSTASTASTPPPSAPSTPPTAFPSQPPSVTASANGRGSALASNGNGSGSGPGTGTGVRPGYRAQPPAIPPSNVGAVVGKAILIIVAIIIVCVILASL